MSQLFKNWRVVFIDSESFLSSSKTIGYCIGVMNQISKLASEKENSIIPILYENIDYFEGIKEEAEATGKILAIPFDEKFDFKLLAKKAS